MSKKLKTCRDCQNMSIDKASHNFVMASCKARNGAVVPHKAENINGVVLLTFHRVPLSCVKPDSEVECNQVGTSYDEMRTIKTEEIAGMEILNNES